MNSADIPLKLPIPWAASAGGGYIRSIPVTSQIGIVDGAASLHDGFVPLNATPVAAGGVPPDVKDMNGILYEISGWSRWAAAGGPVFFDPTFSAAVGGYPKWAVVASASQAGVFYTSTVEGNTTDPEGVGAAGWTRLSAQRATDADALARTEMNKYLSPANLSALAASIGEILGGTAANKFIAPDAFFGARAATADILAGTDDHKYVTPAGLSATGLFSGGANWLRFGSKIVQWGHDTQNVNTTGILYNTNYVVPFSAPADSVVFSAWDTSSRTYNQKQVWRAGAGTATSFPWKLEDTDSGDYGSRTYGLDWIAIGPA